MLLCRKLGQKETGQEDQLQQTVRFCSFGGGRSRAAVYVTLTTY